MQIDFSATELFWLRLLLETTLGARDVDKATRHYLTALKKIKEVAPIERP